MRAKRHFWAALLIFIFVPASMVQAMPLSFCHGADGHKGVEFTASPNHMRAEVGGDPLIVSASEFLATVVGTNGRSGCIDTPLLTDTRSVKVHAKNLAPPLTELPSFYVIALAFQASKQGAAAPSEPPRSLLPLSSQLVSLRTVVLHI